MPALELASESAMNAAFSLACCFATRIAISLIPRLRSSPRIIQVTRRNQQKRIQKENRMILARIRNGKNTKSFYDHKDMGRAEKERVKYIKNISKR